MAMIECPECKKQISDQASICVNCGIPIKKQQPSTYSFNEPQQSQPTAPNQQIQQQPVPYQPIQQNQVTDSKKPIFKKWWFWLLIIMGIIIIIVASSGGGSRTPAASPERPVSEQPIAEQPVIEQPSEQDSGTQSEDETQPPSDNQTTEPDLSIRDNSSAELTTLFSGIFFVGQDIPEGRYVITGNGQGNIFISRAGEFMLFINEILCDGSARYSLGVPSITADLIEGDEIEISGISEVIFTPAITELSTVLSTGYWVVGLDIPAGNYNAMPTNSDESGNFFITTPGRIFPDVNEILAGEDSASAEYGLGVDKVRVNLSDGQVIQISGISSVTFE